MSGMHDMTGIMMKLYVTSICKDHYGEKEAQKSVIILVHLDMGWHVIRALITVTILIALWC